MSRSGGESLAGDWSGRDLERGVEGRARLRGRVLMIVLNDVVHDTRVLRHSQSLSGAGLDVSIVGLQSTRLRESSKVGAVRILPVALRSRHWIRWRPVQILKYLECVVRMVGVGVRAWPSQVHVNDLPALPIGYVISRLTGAGLVYDSHELWSDVVSRTWPAAVASLLQVVERRLARKAQIVITVSESIAEHMALSLVIPKPTVVRNVPAMRENAGPGGESPPCSSSILHAALQLPESTRLVLYQGGISQARGLGLAVEAATSMVDGAMLVFLGDGPGVKDLKRLTAELGVGNRVRFLPAVKADDILNYTGGAWLGIHPLPRSSLNHEFALPNKLFEYLHAGLPVVVSDLKEMATLVTQLGVGLVFPAGDQVGFIRAVNRLLMDSTLYLRCKANVEHAATTLTWRNEERLLLQAYADCALTRRAALKRGGLPGGQGVRNG